MSPWAFKIRQMVPSWFSDHVLQCLERLKLHHVAGRLGFEDRFFPSEGIDAPARLGGRLVTVDTLADEADGRLRHAALSNQAPLRQSNRDTEHRARGL